MLQNVKQAQAWIRMSGRGPWCALVAATALALAAGPAHSNDSAAAGFSSAQADLAIALMTDGLGGEDVGNVVFSPLSAAAALGVATIGASPATGVTISKSLGLGSAPEAAIRLLDAARAITGVKGGPATLALRMVFDMTLSLDKEAGARLDVHGVSHAVDRLTMQGAVDAVNAWVKNETAGAIPTIIDAPPGEGFVALSALRFKGRWQTTFLKAAPGPFRLSDRATVVVPIMSLAISDGLFRMDERFAAVDLPYRDAGYSMVVVTARDERGLTHKDLPALSEWLAGTGFERQEGRVKLPTFTLSTGGDITGTLDRRGLGAARDMQTPFPGFFKDGAAIARIVQRTMVSVDETGTQAAAASAVIATRSAAETAFVNVDASAPFIFCLRNTSSGLILAAGMVADPVRAALQP